MIFKDLENYLITNFPPIELYQYDEVDKKILDLFTPPDETFQEFMCNLICDYTYNYVTCIKDDPTKIDTSLGCHRSIGDIYLLTKNYFSQITLFDVIDELFKKADKLEFYSLYCRHINKLTFFKPESRDYRNCYKDFLYSERNNSGYIDSLKISKDISCSFDKLIKLYNHEKENIFQTTN